MGDEKSSQEDKPSVIENSDRDGAYGGGPGVRATAAS